MMEIILKLRELYGETGTEQMFFPFFPLLVLIIIGLAIERTIAFARISRSIRRQWSKSSDLEESHSRFSGTAYRLDCMLGKHLLWFVVIALFCVFRIGVGAYYGLYDVAYMYRLIGEIELHLLAGGLMMFASDGIFITLEFFLSLLLFLLFLMWKKRLLYRYYLRVERAHRGSR